MRTRTSSFFLSLICLEALVSGRKENGVDTNQAENHVVFFSLQWHLGYFTKEYTPLYRGFDSFFGFLGAKEDYWDHSSSEDYWGYDLRDNMRVGKKQAYLRTACQK